jgi:type II secretory ATPase GspE/PulE/Tfp pilus assembly ATPase PilB-like protein
MYNADTELLFPPRIIPVLRNLRGVTWQRLIDQVEKSDETSPEKVAFVLLMVRINGCASCNADSFRAMHGCTQCAKQAIRRLKDPDKALIKTFESAKLEVTQFQNLKP